MRRFSAAISMAVDSDAFLAALELFLELSSFVSSEFLRLGFPFVAGIFAFCFLSSSPLNLREFFDWSSIQKINDKMS